MKKTLMIAAAAAFAVGGLTVAPEAQAAVWGKCQACHNFTDANKVGPGLGKGPSAPGVFGRKAGTHPDFRYSDSLKDGGWTWDEAHLRKWMCSSKDAIKEFTGKADAKTKMPPQKVCDTAQQDEVLAKLKDISK
ncbi:MAG TPA: cytochrome C [Mariprofundaceae bacterium]|nr:cytochrome C [Mariprofundaceae bacterium]